MIARGLDFDRGREVRVLLDVEREDVRFAILRRRGKLDADVAVQLPGGTLQLQWAGEGSSMWMTGPAEFVFEGEIDV